MSRRPWSHYAAPAAFLLAATVAVLVVRAALDTGSANEPAPVTQPAAPPPTTVATTVRKPGARPAPPPTKTQPAARYYTVVAGDTFGVISARTGVSVDRIEQLNPNVSSNALVIGQKLRIG